MDFLYCTAFTPPPVTVVYENGYPYCKFVSENYCCPAPDIFFTTFHLTKVISGNCNYFHLIIWYFVSIRFILSRLKLWNSLRMQYIFMKVSPRKWFVIVCFRHDLSVVLFNFSAKMDFKTRQNQNLVIMNNAVIVTHNHRVMCCSICS